MHLLSTCDLDRQPGASPLRKAHVQPARLQAATGDQPHRVVGVDAIRATAVGDHLTSLRQFAPELVELVDGSRTSACDMTRAKFSLWPYVKQDDIATRQD